MSCNNFEPRMKRYKCSCGCCPPCYPCCCCCCCPYYRHHNHHPHPHPWGDEDFADGMGVED